MEAQVVTVTILGALAAHVCCFARLARKPLAGAAVHIAVTATLGEIVAFTIFATIGAICRAVDTSLIGVTGVVATGSIGCRRAQ